ncbi:MAG: hypothetical protein HOP11_13650 [Saprospiraceae bacterium]|nr:hypothetical protein [Saprospiraceae bacterium]
MKIPLLICLLMASTISSSQINEFSNIKLNLDTITKDHYYWVEYINRCKLSSKDSSLLEIIEIHLKKNTNNPMNIKVLRDIVESIILSEEIPYVLEKKLLDLYIVAPFNNGHTIAFIINVSFLPKRYFYKKNGSNLEYLNFELFTNCSLNYEVRKMILNSDFLKDDYKKVEPLYFDFLFNKCNSELSIDKMIREACSKKKKQALKKIKAMILNSKYQE